MSQSFPWGRMTDFAALREQAGLTVGDAAVIELLKSLKHSSSDKDGGAFTFIDLFAGIGGLRRGFETIGGKCVFTSEWDKYSQKTYRANFPNDEHEIAGDITQIKEEDIPEHDVLLALSHEPFLPPVCDLSLEHSSSCRLLGPRTGLRHGQRRPRGGH